MICQRAFSVVFLLFKEVASENSLSWLHGTWQCLSQTLWYSGIPQPVSSPQKRCFHSAFSALWGRRSFNPDP